MSNPTIKVLVIDDHTLLLKGLPLYCLQRKQRDCRFSENYQAYRGLSCGQYPV